LFRRERRAPVQVRHESEPKVSKFTKQLGDIIVELRSHLATERAL
jgi:hypothetical protein